MLWVEISENRVPCGSDGSGKTDPPGLARGPNGEQHLTPSAPRSVVPEVASSGLTLDTNGYPRATRADGTLTWAWRDAQDAW